MRSITVSTQFCAVIGNPVGHSLSPAIHNAAFEFLGLDFVYLACRVEDVKGALEGVRALENFRGLSVTIPHKMEAMKYVDEVAEVDRAIGAINTVIHERDRLIGLSTDGPGALKAIADADAEIDGKNVLMLGSGGAARAITFTLARETKFRQLSVLDINEALLKRLAADLVTGTPRPPGVAWRPGGSAAVKTALLTEDSLGAAMENADVIIHCTPVGMHPNEDASLIPSHLFRPGQVVFDIVYTPLQTKLLAEAKSRGLKVIPGVEMFVNQAALQFEHFTGVAAPVEVMRRVVMEHLLSCSR